MSREIALSINELSDLSPHLPPDLRPALEAVVARLSVLFVSIDDYASITTQRNPNTRT